MQSGIECIYKSFQGSGSIYIGKEPNQKSMDELSQYTIRAILTLAPQTQSPHPYPFKYSSLHLRLSKTDRTDLRKHFNASYQFLDKQRTKTNILICSMDKNLCMVFLLAFLMKKYQYDLTYVTRLFEQNIKSMDIPTIYEEQLKRISLQFEGDKKNEEEGMDGSRLGRRIIRIKRDYSNISYGSRFGSLPKKTDLKYNPELNSGQKPMTARYRGPQYQQIATLPMSSRRRSVIDQLGGY